MFKTDIYVNYSYDNDEIYNKIKAKIGLDKSDIITFSIIKKMLKSDGAALGYALTLAIEVDTEREAGILKMRKKAASYTPPELSILPCRLSSRPVIVGAGPAGLFAALYLSLSGARPIVLERGECVEQRQKTVAQFFGGGKLSTESNIQFGEGGAGAFSDGKLKCGAIDKYKAFVLDEFILAGAPPEIKYTVGAHLGTDKLPYIIKNIRKKCISLGAEFIFGAKFTDIIEHDCAVSAVKYLKDGREEMLECSRLILAIGHSARDTFSMLYEKKRLPMEPKGFGIGMRIEHPREYIDRLVLGEAPPTDIVGTAAYHLVSHTQTGRSLYSFCMCPGGSVVAATSEQGAVVTNGMSEYSRMADNSNAALLVSLTPDDFPSDSPLAGFALQEKLEKAAFTLGGENYSAPAMTLGDLMSGKCGKLSESVTPSYARGVNAADLGELFAPDIIDTVRQGIADFDNWMPGYAYPDAFLTGVESRTTSPVKIMRNEKSYETPRIRGVYPIGEGAGYAGGIISSANDGVRCAEAIILNSK